MRRAAWRGAHRSVGARTPWVTHAWQGSLWAGWAPDACPAQFGPVCAMIVRRRRNLLPLVCGCAAGPAAWVPFVIPACKNRYQVPVFGPPPGPAAALVAGAYPQHAMTMAPQQPGPVSYVNGKPVVGQPVAYPPPSAYPQPAAGPPTYGQPVAMQQQAGPSVQQPQQAPWPKKV